MTQNETNENDDTTEQTLEFPDLDHGWAWMVLVASFGSMVVIGGTTYSVGIIHLALLEKYGQDITMTSWVGALHSSMVNLGGPLSTIFIDRFSCRVALVFSACLYVIGYLATAFAPNIEVCFLTCGLIAGLGSSAFTAAAVVIGFNFKQKCNLAMGLSVAGVGVGTFVMAPLFEAARDFYGNTGFFIALTGLTANFAVFGTLCFPSKLELHTHEKRKVEIEAQTKKGHTNILTIVRSYSRVARQKAVICLCIARFGYGVGVHLIYVHLPKYVMQKGTTSTEASFLISISGIIGVLGRILTGIAANHEAIDKVLLHAGSIGLVSLATFLFPLFSNTFAGQIAYVILFGLYFGCCNVVLASINISFVGVEYMSTAIGAELFCGGFGSIVGPLIAGIIVDNGGTYDQSFMVAGSFLLLNSISTIATVVVSKESITEHEEPVDVEETHEVPRDRSKSYVPSEATRINIDMLRRKSIF